MHSVVLARNVSMSMQCCRSKGRPHRASEGIHSGSRRWQGWRVIAEHVCVCVMGVWAKRACIVSLSRSFHFRRQCLQCVDERPWPP